MPQQRYLKPVWLIRRVANPLLMRLRIVPTLHVRGRNTGQRRSVPVNVLELDGERYLVSPRGRRTGSETCAQRVAGRLSTVVGRPSPSRRSRYRMKRSHE
jgi:hypothetical protein